LSALRNQPRAGYLLVLTAAGLWALITPISRYLLEMGTGPFEIAFWRAALAWVLFLVHLALAGRRKGEGRAKGWGVGIAARDAPGLLAFAIVGIAGLYATLPIAVAAGGAALASILLYTAPAWVAMLDVPLLGEAFTRRKLIALCLTLAGVVAFGSASGGAGRISAAALGWGLAAGACYASLYIFGKIYFARYSAPVVFFWTLPVAALLLLPVAGPSGKGPGEWIALATIAGFSTYGAYLAYAAGLARLEASRAAIIATVEPVMAGLLAFLFWRERFSAVGYLGAALILAAVLIAARPPSERRLHR
jgi:drug/metabolite transporter, DME family